MDKKNEVYVAMSALLEKTDQRLMLKTGWGRNEVKALIRDALMELVGEGRSELWLDRKDTERKKGRR